VFFGKIYAERAYRLKPSEPLLDKAERFIRSAQLLAADGDFDSAASRLYYAMFYIAEALLEARGLSFSSHRAVISAFGQYFAKTKDVDPRFHQMLLAAFSQRQLGDYAIESGINEIIISAMLSDAKDFMAFGRDWINRFRGEAQ
jgi:uncharacterized protein (UPF0332 family)